MWWFSEEGDGQKAEAGEEGDGAGKTEEDGEEAMETLKPEPGMDAKSSSDLSQRSPSEGTPGNIEIR